MNKKTITLIIHPEIKQKLQKNTPEKWLKQNIPKYNPKIITPPIPNYEKTKYKPKITIKTLEQLTKIPGETHSTKITNLYFNIKAQQNKKEKIKQRLKKMFPHNKYVRTKQ